ncbi:MAG: RodZ domain-containing protein [Actinomycetota bacterium]
MPGPIIGIGPALKKARVHRGKSVEEAARDTKIRAEYLTALERESFEALLGDVYVRGFLRSYSQYLGLDADKVVTAYTKSVGEPEPSLPPPEAMRGEQPSPARPLQGTHRSSWILAGAVAATLLILAGAAGLLSRRESTPAPVNLPESAPSAAPLTPKVTIALLAQREVSATIVTDGVEEYRDVLVPGEARSFTANEELSVVLGRGGVVDITVNGKDLGTPGNQDEPYTRVFTAPSDAQSPSPAPSPTAPVA